VIAAARGDLDLATAPRAAAAFAQLPPGARRVIVDLSHVDLLDATGYGLLVGLRRRLARVGGKLVLSCPPSQLRELEGSGPGPGFEVADSVATVLAGCTSAEGTA